MTIDRIIANADGSASVIGTIKNPTDERLIDLQITASAAGAEREIRLTWPRIDPIVPANGTLAIGAPSNTPTLRVFDAPIESDITVTARLSVSGSTVDDPLVELSASHEVTPRSTADSAIPDLSKNSEIEIREAVIHLSSDAPHAPVEGEVASAIDDALYVQPTHGVDDAGRTITFRHHTATGGPYGFLAVASRELHFGGPYVRDGGDYDYFDADDVEVGQKITVIYPFPSGDVKAVFTVVAR